MGIVAYDHVALPSHDPVRLASFYEALGFTIVGETRALDGSVVSVAVGDCKINLHSPQLWRNPRFTLRGPTAEPGCGDLCFVWSGTPEHAAATIEAAGGTVIMGPVERTGGRRVGTEGGTSVYTRDPEGNLVEFITYEG